MTTESCMDKDRVIGSMLHNKPASLSKPLIQVLDDDSTSLSSSSSHHPAKKEEDGMSMLEMMMQAQAQASKEQKQKDHHIIQQEANNAFSSAGGFKKGFFSSSSSKKKTSSSSPSSSSSMPSSAAASSPSSASAPSMPTISKKKDSLVIDEVQSNLKDDDNPILQQLKGGSWVTPSLKDKIASNPALAKGLSNPKCLAAIEMMQHDPAGMKKRFEYDDEVSAFMMEFSSIMSQHFYDMAASQQQPASSIASSGPVQEVGPLQAAVLKQAKNKDATLSDSTSAVDDARVKEVLDDEELRSMLLDPQLQLILSECNDPVLFQQHMRNPVTAKKIQRLFQAGLVGTAA